MYKFKLLILLLLFTGLSGCDLLGNQEPQQAIPLKKKNLNSLTALQNLLTGTYNDFQEDLDKVLFVNDIIADDAVFTGSYRGYQTIGNRKMTPVNLRTQNIWEAPYKTINDANIVLNSIDAVDDPAATQSIKDNIRGQALFIRAYQYFVLIDAFALPSGATADDSQLGVSIQLKPIQGSDDFQKPSRSTVAQVYDQIESDLKMAEQLTSPSNSPDRATPFAAMGLRARIALIRHNYQKAANLAGEIINSGKFTLLPDVTTYFRKELSAESIFEIQNTAQDPASGLTLSSEYSTEGRDDIQINISFRNALNSLINDRQQSLLNANSATVIDTRKRDLINGKDDNGDLIVEQSRSAYGRGESNSFKYEDGVNEGDNDPVLRYPEIILTRAEALAHTKGINKESINLLNKIRERAFTVNGGDISLIDYTPADFSSREDLIDAIFLERRVELAFEGHRKTDLQRRKMDVRGVAWDADILTYPIPQTQIDANKNIKQNPAYK